MTCEPRQQQDRQSTVHFLRNSEKIKIPKAPKERNSIARVAGASIKPSA
jgi:hypothetical protein